MLLRSALPLLFLVGSIAAQDPGGTIANPDGSLQSPAAGVGGKKGHGKWSAQLGYFDLSDDGDGNPFLDEDLTVIEPVFLYEYNVSEDTTYSALISYDAVSSASIERLNKFDDQSGASGDYYIGADLGLRHRQENGNVLAGRFHASVEYDYLSLGLGGSLTTESDDKNRAITYSLDAYFDTLDIIRFDGTEDEGTDDRTTFSGSVGVYQVMSPTTHAEFGVTLAHQSGFLETPYNAVVVEDPTAMPNPNLANMATGIEVTEELPDSRMRTSLHGRVRKLLGENTAIELGGRIYDDDWGIQSYTIEPRLYQSLGEDLRLRFRYRLYDQTAADYFAEHFDLTAPEFRTQDSDLREFQSDTVGVKLIWDRTENSTLDFSLDQVSRDDGLDFLVFSFGWTQNF